ncbi:MAG: NAD(P)H-dependent oxidoreductase [Pseudomonadota bacterium]
MRVLLILAHPRPGSLNAAIARICQEALTGLGHAVSFHDLYAEGFDPLLPAAELARDAGLEPAVASYCLELAASDALVCVHPNWWGMPPAALVGWVDRVLRPGVAYEFLAGDTGEGVPRGLLAGKTLVVLNTSDTPRMREQSAFGDPLDLIWRKCIAGLCGISAFHRQTFGVVVTSTPGERAAWLDQARALMGRLFPPA